MDVVAAERVADQIRLTADEWEIPLQRAAEDVLEQERRAMLALCGEAKSLAYQQKATVDVRWLENNVSEWLRQKGGENWRSALVPLLEAIVDEQGTVSASTFGVMFDVRNPYVGTFIGDLMDEFTKDVTQTTRDAISKELRAGVDAGEGLGQLVQRISQYYVDKAPYRATLTARTESLNAANVGAVVAYREAGCQQWEWLATGDERTCSICGPLNGKRFGVDREFRVAHPQCRCTALPVVAERLGPKTRQMLDNASTLAGRTTYAYEERHGPIDMRMSTMGDLQPTGFDVEAELARAYEIHDHVREVYRDARLMKKLDHEGGVINAAASDERMKVGMRLVCTNGDKDAGAGSGDFHGGKGYIKAFLSPYSSTLPRAFEGYKSGYNWGEDPAYVIIHELHHAYGSSTELDTLSDIVAVDYHLAKGNALYPAGVEKTVSSYLLTARERRAKYPWIKAQARAGLSWLYKRHPEQFRKVVAERYGDYTPQIISEVEGWK